MKNILFITDYADKFGGAERCLHLLISKINRALFFPVVLAFKKGQLFDELKKLNIPCYDINVPYIKRPITFINFFIYLFALSKFIIFVTMLRFKHKIDVIYANKTTCVIYSLVCACINNIPCIWHVQNVNKNFGFMGKIIVKCVSSVIMNSEFVKGYFVDYFGNLSKFHVVYNGTEAEKKIRKIDRINTIGMIAHFSPWKNHILFLQIIPLLIKKYPHLKFILFGEDLQANPDERDCIISYKYKIKEKVIDLNIEKFIEFRGYEKSRDKIYPQIDLLIHPAFEEPFGMIIIEAMAYGIPVIASASGGPKEIIEHEQNGLLFKKDDKVSLLNEVEKLLADPKMIQSLVSSGFKTIGSRFSDKSYLTNMENVFLIKN